MGSGLPEQPSAGLGHVGPAQAQRVLPDAGWAVVQNAAPDADHGGDKKQEFNPTKRRQIRAKSKPERCQFERLLLAPICRKQLAPLCRKVTLGEHRQQFATFLTYAALGPTEGYTVEEFRSAIGALPQEGLEESAQALSQALEGAADQREDYWKNRAQPFWQKIWPKSRNLATPRIAESLTHMVIASRGEFPATLAAVQDWLQPIEHPHYVVHLLQKSGLCSRYPADALSLLNAVITDQPWGPRELEQCLKQIVQAKPQLEKEPSFLKLREYDRRRRA